MCPLLKNMNLQALHVASIGDSGFIIIRDGAVFQRSSPMLHELNFPFQIERGVDPSELIEVCLIGNYTSNRGKINSLFLTCHI